MKLRTEGGGRRVARICAIVVLGVVCGTVAVAQEKGRGEQAETLKIERAVARYEEYGYLSGSVLVAKHGKIIYERGVGEANRETHVANTPTTKFGIASLTKQFTSVLVLQQVEEGRIRLDGSVSDYLPWYRKDTGAKMTVEELLHHTSGLPGDFDKPEFGDGKAAEVRYQPQEFAQKFCQPNLAYEPGTKWEYSNCGYALLGLILERATGKPFAELLRERLLERIGMKDTGMNENDLVQHGGAQGYVRHAGPRYTRGPDLDFKHCFSGGGMYSTVEDLYRWNEALTGGSAISKTIREQIFQPGLNDWGYGWFVRKIPAGDAGAGSQMAEMRGDMPGNYFAWILRYPEQDAVIIVLRNGYGSTENFEQNLQAILFGAEPRMPSRSAKDIAARVWLAIFAGVGLVAAFIVVKRVRSKPRRDSSTS